MKIYIECSEEDEDVLGFTDDLGEVWLKKVEITEEEIQSMTYSILFPYIHPPSESWDRDIKRLSRAILKKLKEER